MMEMDKRLLLGEGPKRFVSLQRDETFCVIEEDDLPFNNIGILCAFFFTVHPRVSETAAFYCINICLRHTVKTRGYLLKRSNFWTAQSIFLFCSNFWAFRLGFF